VDECSDGMRDGVGARDLQHILGESLHTINLFGAECGDGNFLRLYVNHRLVYVGVGRVDVR
jgi:hypothetical protein